MVKTVLPVQGARGTWIQFLAREPRSHMLRSMAKSKQTTNTKPTMKINGAPYCLRVNILHCYCLSERVCFSLSFSFLYLLRACTPPHTHTHTLPPFNLELIESKISSSFGCLRIVVHRNREKARSRSMFILVHAILFWVHPSLANEYHPNRSKVSFSTGLKRAEKTNTADGRWSIKLNSEINRKVK